MIVIDFIKNNPITCIVAAYLIIMSAISIAACIYDKLASKTGNVKFRIPEAGLLALSFIGGSVAMLLTMLIIRHKTKHWQFMLGIPIMIILHAVLIGIAVHFGILTFTV